MPSSTAHASSKSSGVTGCVGDVCGVGVAATVVGDSGGSSVVVLRTHAHLQSPPSSSLLLPSGKRVCIIGVLPSGHLKVSGCGHRSEVDEVVDVVGAGVVVVVVLVVVLDGDEDEDASQVGLSRGSGVVMGLHAQTHAPSARSSSKASLSSLHRICSEHMPPHVVVVVDCVVVVVDRDVVVAVTVVDVDVVHSSC